MLTKLFVGFRLTSELKQSLSEHTLLIVRYEGKEYVGQYLEQENPSLADIENSATSLKERIPAAYKSEIVIFPQLFLG